MLQELSRYTRSLVFALRFLSERKGHARTWMQPFFIRAFSRCSWGKVLTRLPEIFQWTKEEAKYLVKTVSSLTPEATTNAVPSKEFCFQMPCFLVPEWYFKSSYASWFTFASAITYVQSFPQVFVPTLSIKEIGWNRVMRLSFTNKLCGIYEHTYNVYLDEILIKLSNE